MFHLNLTTYCVTEENLQQQHYGDIILLAMPRKCPICGKEAKTKVGLAGHLMMAHEMDGKKAHQVAREVVEKEKKEVGAAKGE